MILTVKDLIDHLQTLVDDASATASLTVREASVPSEPLRQRQPSTAGYDLRYFLSQRDALSSRT